MQQAVNTLKNMRVDNMAMVMNPLLFAQVMSPLRFDTADRGWVNQLAKEWNLYAYR